ncbi:MAG: PadR family transcriptional regulator [Chryseotalea sp.]|jgi:DNA-binding PadR family transcriptional regulator|nr:PadR family transcriptional regulator [Flammeovirgaceae bacterium]
MKKPIFRLTTLDFSILGLLMQKPMTGYGIRMMFEKTALASYSSSPGTIYPALSRMKGLGMVEKKKQASSNQELFTITKRGISLLTRWVTQTVTRNDVIRNSEILLLRFAFMDILASKAEKRKFLNSFLDVVNQYIKELEAYHLAESSVMPASGRQAFEHGLELNRATCRWIKNLLNNL